MEIEISDEAPLNIDIKGCNFNKLIILAFCKCRVGWLLKKKLLKNITPQFIHRNKIKEFCLWLQNKGVFLSSWPKPKDAFLKSPKRPNRLWRDFYWQIGNFSQSNLGYCLFPKYFGFLLKSWKTIEIMGNWINMFILNEAGGNR